MNVSGKGSSTAAVVLTDGWFSFGYEPVLESVELILYEGDFLGIIGPNGGGKTTVLRALVGLHRPSGGRVFVNGLDVNRSPDEAKARLAEYKNLTASYERARRFVREVDASVVLVNASTRFNDGGQLGLGAEIGISTSKLHAFGPMGLEELTTTKFVVFGDGQTRT